MIKYNWMPIIGKMTQKKNSLTFKGGKVDMGEESREGSEIGLFICDQYFSDGEISVDVKFKGSTSHTCADIVLFYQPKNRYTINAGLTNLSLFMIRYFENKWTTVAATGAPNNIEPNRIYHLKATMKGSTISIFSDGIETLKGDIPFSLPRGQVGLFCADLHDIEFANFKIVQAKPKVFVVMQYSSPYNEVYFEVIKKICEEENVEVIRIDEESGTGLIIQDIVKSIRDSKLIVADISPLNANVFYEVGYAHALNKPTILIAEKGTKLPFDVSPFRTLFYENSIGGKSKLEEGLRKHVRASLQNMG